MSVADTEAAIAALATAVSAHLLAGLRAVTMAAYQRMFTDFLAFLMVSGLWLPQVSTPDVLAIIECLH